MIASRQWHKIKRVLQDALELDREHWPQFLDKTCGDDVLFRQQVESFLCHHDDAGFMESPAIATLRDDDQPDLAGTTIGHYRIVRALGTGGMGEVFEAEQLEPFVRTVALKLLRRGIVSGEVMARFDSEHQALAMMNHPNVAQVFDADWTEDGRPYFVMEYVPGERITEACDSRRLSLEQRIELYLQVCDGVQHAHQKGIIHRDLKPSNVLVAGQGGDTVAKVIDFGVAKGARVVAVSTATAEVAPGAGHTQIGQWIGTSGYASPEQALGNADVDTRSDIYSLGALLYELLTGLPAYDDEVFSGTSREERRRIICEQMPTLPSRRAATQSETPVNPARLQGDLDGIVCKAMAKQPAQRYSTALELGADLRRYLNHEPVVAVEGGMLYRFGKLIRRRALTVATGAFVIAVILAGTIATGLGYVQAVSAHKTAAMQAERASEEARKARQVTDFLAGLFRVSDPGQGEGESVTAREILDRGAQRVIGELQNQPAVQAMLLDTIGVVYTNLGVYDKASRFLQQGLASRQRLYGERHIDTAASLNHLGKLKYHEGDFERAKSRYDKALEINRALRGDDHVLVADSLNNLGELAVAQGDFETAIAIHKQALTIRRDRLGDEHRDVGMSLNNLAGTLRRHGDLPAAEKAYREAIAVNRHALGPLNPELATNLANLGVFLMTTGHYTEAATLHEEALDIRRRALDGNHPHIANSLHNLGSLRVHLGNYDDAEPLIIESLTMHRELHGHDHPLVALSLNNLGVVRQNQQRHDEALGRFDEALAVFRSTVGDAHPYVGITQTNKARSLVAQTHYAQAGELAAAAAVSLATALNKDHWRVAVANNVLGEALTGQKRFEEAEALLIASHEIIASVQAEDTPYARAGRRRLAALYKAWEHQQNRD